MNNKFTHLLVILFGYIACIYSMLLTWNYLLDASLIFKVLICHIEATIFIYLLSVLFKNSSWYDAFWSVIPVVLTILCWSDGIFIHRDVGSAEGSLGCLTRDVFRP